MKKSLKNFIEENIELIEDGKFKELYSTVRPLELIGKLTETLLGADIDPATNGNRFRRV